KEFLDPKKTYAKVSHQLSKETHPTRKVFLNIYNEKDDFMSQTYLPLLQQYAYILNLDVTFVSGNGHDEASVTQELTPNAYDAFAFNMVKTDNADEYIYILSDK
ncbi:MAG: sugar-binding protein, partial [Lachnospiraceae bacterium]|nr:sugar-binding protein [Lachnospiraceae bacterium]